MDKTRWVREPSRGLVSVVFIHGILSSSDAAWKHPRGAWWPDLLAQEPEFNDIGIYVFDYRSDFFSGNYNLFDAATSLKHCLERDRALKCRRIIFVCHSMGGIVARKFLVEWQSLLIERRIEIGLFLVASPSLGSQDANRTLVRILAKSFGNSQSDALRFAQNNNWLNDLDRSFTNLKEKGLLAIAGKELIEDQSMFLRWLFRRQIVEPFSAARYFEGAFKVEYSDHSTIAKPENRNAKQHKLLCDFIREYRYTVNPWHASRPIDLRIGLSSESPETISLMLGICRNVMNVVLRRPGVLLPYNITIESIREYDEAFAAFDSHLERYDIVMLDDVWLPHFAQRLINLSDLEAFDDYFRASPFENVFVKSLTGACARTGSPGEVFAMPVSGNVQLLMYRQDLISKATGDFSGNLPLGDPDELLQFLLTDRAKEAAKRPFVVRYATDNDLIDNFWEILRAYGYEERYGANGEILISAAPARKALEWIRRAHPAAQVDNLGWKSIDSLASSKDSETMMMLGWPVWIMPDMIRDPRSWRLLAMKKFIRQPISGFWSLAIPATSRYPNQAMQLILALTTVPELQLFMGEAGLVPVLSEFPWGRLKDRYPERKEHFDIVRSALADAKPRPRSARWRDIEKELAKQIRNHEFADCDGLFRFEETITGPATVVTN
jgi:ABC-type glycerol-3-phosphate transport system substrate-binding protein